MQMAVWCECYALPNPQVPGDEAVDGVVVQQARRAIAQLVPFSPLATVQSLAT